MKSQPSQKKITLLVMREAGRPVKQLQMSKPFALALPAAAALSLSSLVTSMHIHASRSIAELEAEAAALSLTNIRMELKVADKEQALQQLRGQVSELSEEAESIKDKLKSVTELEEQLQSLINKETTSSAAGSGSSEAIRTENAGAKTYNADTSTSAASFKGSQPVVANLPDTGAGAAAAGSYGKISRLSAGPFIQEQPEALSAAVSPAVNFRIRAAAATALSLPANPQVGGEYVAVYENDPQRLVEETKDDFEEIHTIMDEMIGSISSTITQAEKAHKTRAEFQAKQAQEKQARLARAVMWPTGSKVITSSFGYRSDPFKGVSAYHSGIDIAGNIGDAVYAALGGVVTSAEQMGARGKYIIIKHDNGLETWYMHLNQMTVTPGERVGKGEQIGMLGSTGRSTGPHLHFQVVKQNKPVNPLNYVKPL
ncbi:M23 family metallopeptidase [Paenibacillus sp. FSL H7-0350]|uniref:M23 family metallopeptidase n=1 Tax=unclassified Paenibacillus TaxID=185978 RepID=UPI0003E1C5D4|nr:M23 family metallopeptidase [Paenibacillus sp. FSL R7-269]ETT52427.1 membrane protein [Paenibacillus sp. FSL R7-269]